MEQKKDALFEQAVNVGLNTAYLERVGYMDILLSGAETPPINLRLRTEHNAVVWMMGTLQLMENSMGETVIKVTPK